MLANDDRDFDERVISIRTTEDTQNPDDNMTADIYMRMGTVRGKIKESGSTICELSFVSADGLHMTFLAPLKSMKELARFIRQTVKEYATHL